jgi:hypothetical protein
MKKALIGLVSAAALALIAGSTRSASARGGDDLCGGCPKDFKCSIVNGAPACVPEDAAPHP